MEDTEQEEEQEKETDKGKIYPPWESVQEEEGKSLKVKAITLLIVGIGAFLLVAAITSQLPSSKGTSREVKSATVNNIKGKNPMADLPKDYSKLQKYNEAIKKTTVSKIIKNPEKNIRQQIPNPARVHSIPEQSLPIRDVREPVTESRKNEEKSSPIFFPLRFPKEIGKKDNYYNLAGRVGSHILQIGSVIPAMLLTGITSDLGPGDVLAQVQDNVYDTLTGQYLLIPKGSRIFGESGREGNYGNPRISVVFTKIIFPNGKTLLLPKQKAIDGTGYQGMQDKYDTHNSSVYRGAFLSALFAAAAQSATGNTYGTDYRSPGQEAVAGSVTSVLQTAKSLVDKDLTRRPTIRISPGYEFNILINEELVIGEYTDV